MTVPHEDSDRLAAEFLAGDLGPDQADALRRRIEADPDARAALDRLEAVVGALQTWRRSFVALPLPALPRSRRCPFHLAPAAAALVAAGLLVSALVTRPSRPRPTPAGDEFLALAEAQRTLDAVEPPHLLFEAPNEGPQFGGAGGMGPDRGDPAPDVVALFDRFRRQFRFSFRLPARLPGDLELERARPLSASAVELFYETPGKRLRVTLKPSTGPDEVVHSRRLEGRLLWVARRSGLALALEGDGLDRDRVEALIPLFLPR